MKRFAYILIGIGFFMVLQVVMFFMMAFTGPFLFLLEVIVIIYAAIAHDRKKHAARLIKQKI